MIRLAEAKTVTLRERRWLRRLQQLISRSLPSATLVLYGSAARGTRSADSDYDLVILTPSPLTVEQRDAIRAQIYDFDIRFRTRPRACASVGFLQSRGVGLA
ncbi:MAG: hypothetical protein C4335_09385 [Armatimonadota bacterium]